MVISGDLNSSIIITYDNTFDAISHYLFTATLTADLEDTIIKRSLGTGGGLS